MCSAVMVILKSYHEVQPYSTLPIMCIRSRQQMLCARVNQRYVPLTYALKTGEQVEILTKKDREPNRDWLVNSLGYIKTARA